jgi:hypothetical protein
LFLQKFGHILYLYYSKLEYCFHDQKPNHLNLSCLIPFWKLQLLVIMLGQLIILYFQLLILFKHILYLYCSMLGYCFHVQMPNHLNLFYLIPSLIN